MALIIGAATDKHREQMERLAAFVDADSVQYIDHGNGEDYIIAKGDQSIMLAVRGNNSNLSDAAVRAEETSAHE